jgi:hypothetical protein
MLLGMGQSRVGFCMMTWVEAMALIDMDRRKAGSFAAPVRPFSVKFVLR